MSIFLNPPRFTPSPQSGRSLIEIMIALALGLIMSAAIMGAFVANQQTNTQSSGRTRLVNEGSLALGTFGRLIRQAGFGEIASATRMGDASRDLTLPPVHGCDGGYSPTGNDKVAALSSYTCNSGASSTASDAITLSMQVEPVNCGSANVSGATAFNDNANWGGDILGNCIQAELNARGVAVSQVAQRFAVVVPAVTTGLPPSIYARTSRASSRPQPLVDNVEQMRFRYLVSSNNSGEGDQYMTATQLNTANRFKDVVGVSVCLLMSTENNGTNQNNSANYLDCDGTSRTSTDSKLRMTFQNTFVMRNRATAISHTD